MSQTRIIVMIITAVFGVLLYGLIDGGSEVDLYGLTLPAWVAALGAYLFGWAATFIWARGTQS